MPKRIRDPIHGYVPVDDPMLAVLDTPEVQRLRRIRQLGTASLVYPGANHTRFEHSLGASHLGGLAAESLGLGPEEALDLRLALLLHDVGHGPFSHLSEPAMKRTLGLGHKDLGIQLIQSELRGTVERAGGRVDRVAAMIDGRGDLGALVSGDLDLDRMDYIVRDAHYTGVNVGVDLQRLLQGIARRGTHRGKPLLEDARHRGSVVIREDALQAAELLLTARFLMYSTVYFHHAARVAERMVARGMDLLLEGSEVEPMALARMDDGELFHALHHSRTFAAELARRLDGRALLKGCAAFTAEQAGKDRERLRDPEECAEVERNLAAKVGADPRLVILDVPDFPVLPEVRAPVLAEDGSLQALSERSALVGSLHRAQLDHWRMRVYGPAEHRDALWEASRGLFA